MRLLVPFILALILAGTWYTASRSSHVRTAPRAAAPEPPSRPGPRRIPVVAEALGYLGAVLATVGLVLVVTRYWPEMAVLGRLGLSGAGAVALFAGGVLVRENADAALARLRWSLWLASTAATALFAAVLTVDTLGLESAETVVLGCAGGVAVLSGLMWRGRRRPVQQLTFLGGVAVFVGALIAHVASAGAVGLAVWAVGAACVAGGIGHRMPLPALTEGAGAVIAIVGAAITVSPWPAFGLLFVLATGFGLVALATVPALGVGRPEQLTAGVLGGLAVLQGWPSALGYFGREAGGLTGLTTWLFGGALFFVGMRRLVRAAPVAEILGGLAMIGGAALTGVQWQGFAPLFGVATAVALVGLGMLPGHVMMSILGSAGMLINVPWAIAWFFPGEARVPVLILVSGAVILVIAVVLTRGGGFRGGSGDRLTRLPGSGVAPGANAR